MEGEKEKWIADEKVGWNGWERREAQRDRHGEMRKRKMEEARDRRETRQSVNETL